MEAKTHFLYANLHKLRRLATSHTLPQAHLVGRFPTPGLTDFVWGGLIFNLTTDEAPLFDYIKLLIVLPTYNQQRV